MEEKNRWYKSLKAGVIRRKARKTFKGLKAGWEQSEVIFQRVSYAA